MEWSDRGMILGAAAGLAGDASFSFNSLDFRVEQSGRLSIIPRSCPDPGQDAPFV